MKSIEAQYDMDVNELEEIMSEQNMDAFKVDHPAGNLRDQQLYKFPNGYGASVITNGYGSQDGLLELAVIHWVSERKYNLVYDSPIADDVMGYLTEAQVQETLASIFALEAK